jgi:Ca-activated chloride channel family protein
MWAQALEKTTASSLYADYLRLRESYGNQTGFYLDIADKFIEYGLNDQALRVLSSLSELQGEDARTLRILAHRLLQIGHVDLAIHVFKDVLSVRNEEPQSYRDLGLALAAAGRYSEAIQHLLYVLEHPWHNRFPEIERIVARELSRIAALPAVKGISIPKEYLIPFQNDVRVVLTWDADNCDMDLWVTDPDGELCMYSNRFTKIGGCLSRDLTGGYGPEEFVLPTAKKGAYKVEVHYYGSRQQTVTRPTTVQVDMFTKYGSTSEKHHAVTMRLDGVSRLLDIGTILVE